jgi:hypothetical protein
LAASHVESGAEVRGAFAHLATEPRRQLQRPFVGIDHPDASTTAIATGASRTNWWRPRVAISSEPSEGMREVSAPGHGEFSVRRFRARGG